MFSIVAKLKNTVTGYEGEKVRNWGEKGGVEERKGRERNVIKKNNKALVPMFHIFTVRN